VEGGVERADRRLERLRARQVQQGADGIGHGNPVDRGHLLVPQPRHMRAQVAAELAGRRWLPRDVDTGQGDAPDRQAEKHGG
jgi:hypothetical protein